MPPPVALLDARGRFLWLSSTHVSFGLDAEQFVGGSLFDLACDPADARRKFATCILERVPQRLEGNARQGDPRLNFIFDITPAEVTSPVAAVGFGYAVRRRLSRLSIREREVVRLLTEDLSIAEIGAALHISRSTVESHLQHAKSKLGCRGIGGLVRLAVEGGLASSGWPKQDADCSVG